MAIQADKQAEAAALRSMGVDAVEKVTVTFANVLLSAMPIENGHGHEAVMTALEQVPNARIARVPQSNMGVRSGDPLARKAGFAEYGESDAAVSVSLEARLPFLHTLEVGGTIRVGDLSGNQGQKTAGMETLGELYASRKGDGRPGVLMWRDASGKHFRYIRNVSPGLGFMARAASVARLKAKQLGLKKR